MKHQTPDGMSLLHQTCILSFGKNPNQTSDMVTEPAPKQQCSNKSLKINHKALKELKSGTP